MEQAAGYDEKADIWSFGITALELAYGYAPYAKFQPMKVMLLTLQEEPPTADIYHDTSYAFSKHFHSLVAKCLKKDSAKRPSARRLLEHKFFKSVRGREYVQELIVKKLPKPKRAAEATAVVRKKEQASSRQQAALGDADVGGVSVGSWVFDPEEFQEMKRAIALEEAKEGRKRPEKIVEKDVEDDEDDYGATPLHSPHLSPAHPAVASMPPQHLSSLSSLSSPALPASSSSSSSAAPAQPRNQSHGRFHVTEHILDQPAPAQSPYPYPVDGALGAGESLASAYAAMAAGTGGPTVSHSRVGRFAVTDEQHH